MMKLKNSALCLFAALAPALVLGVTVTLETAETRQGVSQTSDASTWAFFATNVNGTVGTMWSDHLPPHPGADYLVSGVAAGQAYPYTDIWLDASYWMCNVSAGRSGNYYVFGGDSLTIGDRGRLVAPTHTDSSDFHVYDIKIADLRFDSGSALWDGSWNGGIRTFAAACTITVLASEESPAVFWRDWAASSAAKQSCATHFVFDSALAGGGWLRFAGGSAAPSYPQTVYHQYDLTGDTTAFTGTIEAGAFTNLQNRYNTKVSSDGSLVLALGGYGLANGSLVFRDANPRLTVKSISKAMVPVKNLSLADGTVILVGGICGNDGKGIAVTDEFTLPDSGVVHVDCTDVDFEYHVTRVLSVPASFGLSADSFDAPGLAGSGCRLSILREGGADTLAIINDDVDDDPEYIVMDEPDSISSTSDKSAFFATNVNGTVGTVWSDDLAVHAGGDYLVPSGYSIAAAVNWNFCFIQTGRGTSEGVVFYGDSLTIDDGAVFYLRTHVADPSYNVYDVTVPNLRLKGGSQVCEDGSWQGGLRRFRSGVITVLGKESNPAAIWGGQTYSGSTDPAKAADFYFNCDLAGDGYLRLSGGGINESNRAKPHFFDFSGDNDAFTGVMLVGGTGYLRFGGNPVGSRGNLDIYLGDSGLANGSLVFDDPEPRLGVSSNATGAAMIPLKDLTLAAGSTILAGTAIARNNGLGFSVSGSYCQSGVVTVDVAQAAINMPRVKLLEVAAGNALDAGDFVLVNNPNDGFALAVEGNALFIANPEYVDLTEVRFAADDIEVLIAADAPKPVKFAASEATNFLSQALGTAVRIVNSPTYNRSTVSIGENEWSRAAGLSTNDLVRDEFIIRAVGGMNRKVFLLGRDDASADLRRYVENGQWSQISVSEHASLFAVYEFLERFVGCRFFYPDDSCTVVPAVDGFAVPTSSEIRLRPYFTSRDIYCPTDPTYSMALAWLRLRLQTETIRFGHGQRNLDIAGRFVPSHPEYSQLRRDGTRNCDHVWASEWQSKQLCESSALWDELYLDIVSYVGGGAASSRGLGGWPYTCTGRRYVDVMPQDGMQECFCSDCQAAYNAYCGADRSGQYATKLVWEKTAALANRLLANNIDACICQMAYTPYRDIPDVFLPSNICVEVAETGPWSTADETEFAREIAEIRAWSEKMNSKVWTWTYPSKTPDPYDPAIPCEAPRAWAKFYKAAAPYIRGAFAESELDKAFYSHISYYVFSRLAWDIDADVEDILDDYFAKMYEGGAADMAAFYSRIETDWLARRQGKTPISKIYTLAELATLSNLLDHAEAAASGKAAERVRRVRTDVYLPLAARIDGSFRDAAGHYFEDEDYYVQFVKYGSSADFFSCSDTPGVVNPTWSDGLAPHADADYYIPNGKTAGIGVSYAFLTAYDNQVQCGSVTVGSGATLSAYGYGAALEYYHIGVDLRLCSNSRITLNADDYCFDGRLTVLATDENYPAYLTIGSGANTNATLYFFSSLHGAAGTYLRVDRGASPGTLRLAGATDGFHGSLIVSSGATLGGDVRLENLVLENGAIIEPGITVTGSLAVNGTATVDVSRAAIDGNRLAVLTAAPGIDVDADLFAVRGAPAGFSFVTEGDTLFLFKSDDFVDATFVSSSEYTVEWSDGLETHAGANYLMDKDGWNYLRIRGTDSAFEGSLLTVKGTGANYIFHAAGQKDVVWTANLRMFNRTYLWHGYWGGAPSSFTLNGRLEIGSTAAAPFAFIASQPGGRFIVNSTLTGASTNVFSTGLTQNSAAAQLGACTNSLEITGDASGYCGTVNVISNTLLRIGVRGLPNATVSLKGPYSFLGAVTNAADAAAAVSVPFALRSLVIGDGAALLVDCGVGFAADELTVSGAAKIVLPADFAAKSLTVLTVPSSCAPDPAAFEVVNPAGGYSLQLFESGGVCSLVYQKDGPGTKLIFN